MSDPQHRQPPANPVVIGKLGGPYGIRGWLKVFASTEQAESIFDYLPWFIRQAGQWQPIEPEDWKHHNQGLIVKLHHIDDRDSAARLTNSEIVIDASQLPALDDGDYYWKDLKGCQVVTDKGYTLGEVTDLMETGSNDVLVVRANLNDAFGVKERLIPFLYGQVIQNVDLATRTIVVDWDPGF